MTLQNMLNAAIPIPDIPISGGLGIVLAPLSTVTIFNSAGNASNILTSLVLSGIISVLDSNEPAQGNGMQVSGAIGAVGPVGPAGPQGAAGVAGATGPQGPAAPFFVYSASISSGTVSGTTLILPIAGLLGTDTIISIVNNMGANLARSGGVLQTFAGYTAQADGTVTLIFDDVVPPSGSITITVKR